MMRPGPGWRDSPAMRAPVVGIRLESDRTSRVGKVVVGGVALGVAGCVLAISLFRGGVIATRAFYGPAVQVDLPLTPDDDYAAVVRTLGQPATERWRSAYSTGDEHSPTIAIRIAGLSASAGCTSF